MKLNWIKFNRVRVRPRSVSKIGNSLQHARSNSQSGNTKSRWSYVIKARGKENETRTERSIVVAYNSQPESKQSNKQTN